MVQQRYTIRRNAKENVMETFVLEGEATEVIPLLHQLGTRRVRVTLLPEPLAPMPFTMEEWETAMDSLADGADHIPYDPTVKYDRADFYVDHD
jgi:hypothetical protein